MAKDKYARHENRVTVMAIGNLIAALVDTMRAADVPNGIVHDFLDKLERLNGFTLFGDAGEVMDEIIDVVRGSVPSND